MTTIVNATGGAKNPVSTGFNIEKFRSQVTPPLRANKFLVQVSKMPDAMVMKGSNTANTPISSVSLSKSWSDALKGFDMYAEIVDLPGVSLSTLPVRRWGYGPVELKPYEPRYEGCRIVLRGDQKGAVFDFMRTWQSVAVNYQMGPTDVVSMPTGSDIRETASKQMYPYEVGYKSDYAAQVEIIVFADNGDVAQRILLNDAYPVEVGVIPLTWSESKSYAQLPVMLAYSRYSVNYGKGNLLNNLSSHA